MSTTVYLDKSSVTIYSSEDAVVTHVRVYDQGELDRLGRSGGDEHISPIVAFPLPHSPPNITFVCQPFAGDWPDRISVVLIREFDPSTLKIPQIVGLPSFTLVGNGSYLRTIHETSWRLLSDYTQS